MSSEDELESLSMEALAQMDEKQYDLEMKEEGIENIIKLGIAFSSKFKGKRTMEWTDVEEYLKRFVG